MSYEGYYTFICKKGHKWDYDATTFDYSNCPARQTAMTCSVCKSKAKYYAQVDETNGVDPNEPETLPAPVVVLGYTESKHHDHRGNRFYIKHPTYAHPPDMIGVHKRWRRIGKKE